MNVGIIWGSDSGDTDKKKEQFKTEFLSCNQSRNNISQIKLKFYAFVFIKYIYKLARYYDNLSFKKSCYNNRLFFTI